MRKRIICLLLSAVMILPVFLTSCSSTGKTVNTSRSIVDINLFAVTDEITSDEAVKKVEERINLVTLSKYKTRVHLNFCTEENYRNIVDNATEIGAEKRADLFMLTGSDMLLSYAENGKLFSMTESLQISTKLITDYIHPAIIDTAKIGDDIFAIPSNKQVETTTYYLVDKNLASKYDLNIDRIRDISDFYDFLVNVKRNEADYVPMEVIPNKLYGFDYMYDENYLIGLSNKEAGPFDEKTVATDVASAFRDDGLSTFCEYIQTFAAAGLFAGENTGKKVAVRVQELTDSEFNANYADQYVRVVYKHPRATMDNSLDYAWAVNANGTDAGRAMEVLMLLTTNEEVHNVFTFGLKDENYTVNDDGSIHLLGAEAATPYSMNFYGTGNSLIGLVPETISATYQQDARSNNSNLMSNAFIGFSYTLSAEELTEMQEYRSIISEYYYQIFGGSPNYAVLMNEAEDRLDKLGYNEFIKRINAQFSEMHEE